MSVIKKTDEGLELWSTDPATPGIAPFYRKMSEEFDLILDAFDDERILGVRVRHLKSQGNNGWNMDMSQAPRDRPIVGLIPALGKVENGILFIAIKWSDKDHKWLKTHSGTSPYPPIGWREAPENYKLYNGG